MFKRNILKAKPGFMSSSLKFHRKWNLTDNQIFLVRKIFDVNLFGQSWHLFTYVRNRIWPINLVSSTARRAYHEQCFCVLTLPLPLPAPTPKPSETWLSANIEHYAKYLPDRTKRIPLPIKRNPIVAPHYYISQYNTFNSLNLCLYEITFHWIHWNLIHSGDPYHIF